MLVIPIVFAAFFYGAAEYEHMNGWKWAAASGAVSIVVRILISGFIPFFVAQVALFGVLWWKTSKRLEERAAEQARYVEDDRTMRQERVRRGREEAERRQRPPQ